jgi:hypothetical protein
MKYSLAALAAGAGDVEEIKLEENEKFTVNIAIK